MGIARRFVPLTISLCLGLMMLTQGLLQVPRSITTKAVSPEATSSGACPLDIYFLVDLTASFEGELAAFESAAPHVLPILQASNPNTRFGLGGFQDYPFSPYGEPGNVPYTRVVDLTFDTNAVVYGISGLAAAGGGDLPESQLPALHETATGAGHCVGGTVVHCVPPGQQASFRASATKLVLLWTDAPFHQDYLPSAPSYAQAVTAIDALGHARVVGISSAGGGLTDLQSIAEATGARAPAGGADCDGDGSSDIPEGQPLVCTVGPQGEGISEVIVALVEAAEQCRVFLPLVMSE